MIGRMRTSYNTIYLLRSLRCRSSSMRRRPRSVELHWRARRSRLRHNLGCAEDGTPQIVLQNQTFYDIVARFTPPASVPAPAISAAVQYPLHDAQASRMLSISLQSRFNL
jgi:hypothetical protein